MIMTKPEITPRIPNVHVVGLELHYIIRKGPVVGPMHNYQWRHRDLSGLHANRQVSHSVTRHPRSCGSLQPHSKLPKFPQRLSPEGAD